MRKTGCRFQQHSCRVVSCNSQVVFCIHPRPTSSPKRTQARSLRTTHQTDNLNRRLVRMSRNPPDLSPIILHARNSSSFAILRSSSPFSATLRNAWNNNLLSFWFPLYSTGTNTSGKALALVQTATAMTHPCFVVARLEPQIHSS
jgi:hypothetical protein